MAKLELKPEQLRVINHNEGNFLVSASAGSGKTFTMIKRLIRLITEGKASVKDVLAVTFTEKSALDVKEKLVKALLKEINSGNEQLKIELNEVQTADISTMHSFCSRLLRSNFYLVGIPADFSVLDEREADLLKSKAMEELFSNMYEENEDWVLDLIDKHAKKRKDKSLRKEIEELYSFAISEAHPIAFLKKTLNFYSKENFNDFANQIKNKINIKLDDFILKFKNLQNSAMDLELNTYVNHLQELIVHAEVLKSFSLHDMIEEPISKTPTVKFNEDQWEKIEVREELKKLKDSYKKYTDKIKEYSNQEIGVKEIESIKIHSENLIKIVERYVDIYRTLKLDEGVLDFNDLEHYTLKLLENEEFLKSVKNRYKYIFVDEYQDTNGVQEEILSKLSNNNLYMVGDVKQSIYAFRGCNAGFFTDRYESMDANSKETLNHNFRSSSKVIEYVNDVFDVIMTKGTSNVDYKNTARLITGGGYGDYKGRASYIVVQKEEEKESNEEQARIYDVIEESKNVKIETQLEGKLISDIIEDELTKKYFDIEDGKEKRIKYGDIAILVRSKNKAVEKIIEELKRRGIPLSVERKESILEYKEVAVLVELLRFIDNAKNEIPYVATLKNVWGFTENELAKIKLNFNEYLKDKKERREKRYFYQMTEFYEKEYDDEISKKLSSFNEYFARIRTLSGFLSAREILNEVIDYIDFKEKIVSTENGEVKLKRIERFLSESERFNKKLSVKEFLSVIESSDGEFNLSEANGEDAVKILTMHSSKGLEFPVVIVANVFGKFNFSDQHASVLKDRDFGFSLKYFDETKRETKETLFRTYLKDKINSSSVKEELRLFYVALTRAKYSLYITGATKKEIKKVKNLSDLDVLSATSYADFLATKTPIIIQSSTGETFNENSSKKILIGKGDEELTSLIKENVEYVYPYREATTLPLKTSPTANLKTESVDFVPLLTDETSKEKGTVAHKILELFDLTKANAIDVESEFERIKTCGVISLEEFNGVNLEKLKEILISGLFNEIKEYKCYKEQGFIVSCNANMLGYESEEEIMLQGVIDLLCVKDGVARIYDYKYSTKSKESLILSYKKQLEYYKYAVEKALNLKVEKTVLISLLNGEFIEIS